MEWLFFLSGLSVVSFFSIFRPALGEASSGGFYRGSTRPVEFIIVSLPWTIMRSSNNSSFDRQTSKEIITAHILEMSLERVKSTHLANDEIDYVQLPLSVSISIIIPENVRSFRRGVSLFDE